MELSRQEQEIEHEWLSSDRYTSGLSVSPYDLMLFLEDFSEPRLHDVPLDPTKAKLKLDEATLEVRLDTPFNNYDANAEPNLDTESLHFWLSSFFEHPAHENEVLDFGGWLSENYGLGATDAQMFAWGYNLYFGILSTKRPLDKPPHFYAGVLDQLKGNRPAGIIEQLDGETSENAGFLAEASAGLLDGLIKVHAELGDIKNTADAKIREERLKLFGAGAGLAYLQWQHHLNLLTQPLEDYLEPEEPERQKVPAREKIKLFHLLLGNWVRKL